MIHSGFHRTILFLATLLLACHPLSGQHKDTAADSVMFAINMRLYDSILTPSFPKMYKRALQLAKESGNESAYITVRRQLISKYALENEQEKFMEESDRMIEFCQESGTDEALRLLYIIWNFKAEYQDRWNREEMWETVEEMARHAQLHRSDYGLAMAYNRFGSMYLNRHQVDEAEAYFLKTWNLALKNDLWSMAVRVGFNRLSIKMNINDYTGGLAVADSLETIIARQKRVAPGTMANLARCRCKLLYLNGDLEKAAAQKDTMLYWYSLDPDPSMQDKVFYTLAGYKMYTGDLEGSCADFDSLAQIARRKNNWQDVVNYTYALADARRQQGELDKAVEAYNQHAAAKDSAAVQEGNARLDELTKRYELNELQWAHKKAQLRFYLALTAAFLMLVILGIYIFYNRTLHKKNRMLYDKIKEMDRQQELVTEWYSHIPESKLTKKERLFRDLQLLMNRDKLHRNPKLNREILCVALGTNSQYLAESIRDCANGQTVSEFINAWRLREAQNLLIHHEKMSIVEVGEVSGFGSDASFFRLFRKHFGLTPSQFRQISKEQNSI